MDAVAEALCKLGFLEMQEFADDICERAHGELSAFNLATAMAQWARERCDKPVADE